MYHFNRLGMAIAGQPRIDWRSLCCCDDKGPWPPLQPWLRLARSSWRFRGLSTRTPSSESRREVRASLVKSRVGKGCKRVPGRVFKHISLNNVWGVRPVVTLTDEGTKNPIVRSDRPKLLQRLFFAHSGCQPSFFATTNRRGNYGLGKFVERTITQDAQHLTNLVFARADVTSYEWGKSVRQENSPWMTE